MSDVVALARTARESLARGLNALQGDPQVPAQLLELAAPIAQAMGALHQIERSSGAQLAPNAQHALANLQHALAQLQAQPARHQAVLAAAEAVAGALGHVHALTRAGQPAAAGPAGAAAAPAGGTRGQPAQPQQPPQAAPARPAAQPTAPQAQRPAPARAATGGAAAQPARPGEVTVVAAELGAHSPTNFYKGLSGNDIVEHGGLFVSTYKLPKLGQPVRLRVSLPGGYEFEANAVVRWRREANDAGSDAPPGFGAQFTEITSEARQLVYRYVRNREPMFHDDL
ncbi:MAG TPA: PilZ domain-containing protein [Polyangiaceae bacterium]|nr:PilZ domain-containing protein [Polyangiaceae bacterium]